MTMTRNKLVPIGVAIAAIALGLVFRDRLVAWFTGRAIGGTASEAVTIHAGDLTLAATLDPDPPRQDGAVHLTITDASGAPVDGATVAIDYDMPAMGSMGEMRGALKVVPEGGGRYRGEFSLPMGGTWTLVTTVTAGARTAAADFRLTVGSPGMTASAARRADDAPGAVTLDPARKDAMGVRTAPAIRAPMTLTIRSVGRVTFDESHLTDVSVKLKGWVQHLDVSATGTRVARGQRLFTLYSPDLYAAQQEYLIAAATPGNDALVAAAAKKLALYGMTPAQITELAARGTPLDALPVTAPAGGTVIEKDVVEGAAIEPGMKLFRLAALDEVWIEADLFEGDLPLVQKGQHATITLSYLPGRTLEGTVAFVYPYLDPTSRTGRVRIVLPNKDGALKPEMYANVALDVALGPRTQVPISAVVITGRRRIVFVDAGNGTLRPREVTLGARTDDMVEVVSGVAPGEQVVVAGDFLVASESRLRSSALWSAP